MIGGRDPVVCQNAADAENSERVQRVATRPSERDSRDREQLESSLCSPTFGNCSS